MDFVFLQGRPTDPRKKTDASDDLPPWSCMPTNAATVEVALQNQDSASSIAAWRKRDEKGTVLIEVAKSEAGHGVQETDDVEHHAASSSSRPAKEWCFFRGLAFVLANEIRNSPDVMFLESKCSDVHILGRCINVNIYIFFYLFIHLTYLFID